MDCKEVRHDVDAFRTGELVPGYRKRVAVHLAQCASCSGDLAAITQLAKLCRSRRVRAPKQILDNILTQAGDKYARVGTRLGDFWVGFNLRGLTAIERAAINPGEFEIAYRHRSGRGVQPGIIPGRLARAVQQAVTGVPAPAIRVDLSSMPEFVRKVLLLLRTIPRGEVRPYSWLARAAGRPLAVRAVGNIMARNPIPFVLPCHRVVPMAGGIGEYGFGAGIKRDLLLREGAPVAAIEEFARSSVRYIGCKTTGIYCFPTCRAAGRIRRGNSVPLHSLKEAHAGNYRPCRRCKPPA